MTSHEPENLFPGFEDVPYEIFIVNAPIGIFVADENGRYTFINDAACAMTGYEKDELIGKNLSQFIFPEDRERAKEQFQKVRETGAAVGEFRYITKSGEVRYWEVKAVKVSDSCHIGYKSDITEKKLAEAELIMKNDELQGTFETLLSTEEELRQQLEEILAAQEEIKERERQLKETNSFLENLINRANVPIIVWDPSFKILRVNHAFEHLVGSSADDIVGKSLDVLFAPSESERTARLILTTLEGVNWETAEIPIIHKSGKVKTVLWNSATIFNESGNVPLATIAQGRDITAERELEREKDEATSQIRENIAKLAILNDGIRNPLTIIATYIEMATDRETGELILREIRRIDEMVTNLDREWINSEKILNFLKKHDFERTGFDTCNYQEVFSDTLPPEKRSCLHPSSKYALFIEELQAQLFTILDSIDALVYVSDMETHEVLYLNKQGRYLLGNAQGQKCYSLFQDDPEGPCLFCTNHLLVKDKIPTGVYKWEYFNPKIKRWFDCRDRAIRWTNGQLVRLEIATDITEKKRYEEAIKQSEEWFKTIVNSIRETMSVIDRNGTFIYANVSAAKNLSGKEPSHVIGRNIRDFLPEDLAEAEVKKYQAVIDSSTPITGEVTVEMQGKMMRFYNQLIPLRFNPDDDPAVLSLSLDITEIYAARESLMQRDEQYRRIVDTAEEGIWQIDSQKNTVYVNPRMAKMLGYTPEEMTGHNIMEFMPPEELEGHAIRMVARMQGKNERYEQSFVKKDGSRIWARVSATANIGPDGTFNGAFSMLTDITEQKMAENALHESETRFHELFNNMPAAVAIYQPVDDGRDFIFYDFNRAGEEIEKIPREDVIGQSILKVFPGVREFGLFEVIQRVFRTGAAEKHPISVYEDDRIAGWRDNYVYRLPSGEVVAIYEDITERKEMENRLADYAKKLLLLTQINRHDIFNELTAMHIINDIILDTEVLEKIYSYIHMSNAGLDRIERVLQFTRDYDDFASYQSKWFNLKQIVNHVRIEVLTGDIIFVNDVSEKIQVFSDPIIRKVFRTLFENALRHGKTLSKIRIYTKELGNDLVIFCEDDGVGIPGNEKEAIFTYGHGKNTGIGLFLAKEMLSVNNMTICESGVEGLGSRFEIVVPERRWRLIR